MLENFNLKIMKKRVYLDDIRTPIAEDWIVARDYDSFITKVNEIGLGNIEVISLDHDLGDTAIKEYFENGKTNYNIDYKNITEKTGYDAAKWLVAESMTTGIPLPQMYSHSANPIGAANIIGYINNYFKNCRQPQTCIRVQIPHTT